MVDRHKVSMINAAPLPSRSEVVRLMQKHVHLLDEGARVIATNVEVPWGTPIDVLAVGGDGSLLIIDVFDGGTPSWLVHMLHHMRWVDEHYAEFAPGRGQGRGIAQPRVRAAGVVARMSTPTAHALSLLKELPVNCFRVRCFTNGEESFLLLERRTIGSSTPAKTSSRGRDIRPVELTEDEIADFLAES